MHGQVEFINCHHFKSGGIAVALSVICVPFVAPAFRKYCLPYVPATDSQVENILKLISGKCKNGTQRLLDIGSGDGRIVIGECALLKISTN